MDQARETQLCELTNDPVMIPEFQGVPPTQAFTDEPGACVWSSDYWGVQEWNQRSGQQYPNRGDAIGPCHGDVNLSGSATHVRVAAGG